MFAKTLSQKIVNIINVSENKKYINLKIIIYLYYFNKLSTYIISLDDVVVLTLTFN